jgi:hypothetical protein
MRPLSRRLRPFRLPDRAARQLPDQSSRGIGSRGVILSWYLLAVSRSYLQSSHSFVPASLPFSLASVQRVPDAVLLESSCGGNPSSWAWAFILLRPRRLRVHGHGRCGKFGASRASRRTSEPELWVRLGWPSARRIRSALALTAVQQLQSCKGRKLAGHDVHRRVAAICPWDPCWRFGCPLNSRRAAAYCQCHWRALAAPTA